MDHGIEARDEPIEARGRTMQPGCEHSIVLRFDEAFADLPEIHTPRQLAHRTHTYHIYAIHLDRARLAIDRAQFIEMMTKRGIGTSVHFIPLHRHPYYAVAYGHNVSQFPTADSLFEGLVSLPCYPRMTEQDVEDVIAAVREIVIANRLPAENAANTAIAG